MASVADSLEGGQAVTGIGHPLSVNELLADCHDFLDPSNFLLPFETYD